MWESSAHLSLRSSRRQWHRLLRALRCGRVPQNASATGYDRVGEASASVGLLVAGGGSNVVEVDLRDWRSKAAEYDADMRRLSDIAASLMQRATEWGDSERIDSMSMIMTVINSYAPSPSSVDLVELQVVRQRFQQ